MTPPQPWYLTPDWWQVILVVAGTLVAAAAFMAERRAIRLTQRADLLVNAIHIEGPPLAATSEVKAEFRNFGPTRASDVRLRAWLEFENIRGSRDEKLPTMVVGAGDTQTVCLDKFGTFMTREAAMRIVRGEGKLELLLEAHYRDVFGKEHFTRERATYRHTEGTFHIIEREAS